MPKLNFPSGFLKAHLSVLDVGNEHTYISALPLGGMAGKECHSTQLTASEEIIPQTTLVSL